MALVTLAPTTTNPTTPTPRAPSSPAVRTAPYDGVALLPPAADHPTYHGEPPPTNLLVVGAGTMMAPLPLPSPLMCPSMIRDFLHTNTDFRKAPLFGVYLPCPYLLATATCDCGYIIDHMVPAVLELTEGSIWGLTDPAASIVLTSNNSVPTLHIDDWIRRQGHDPWRGIEATVVRCPTNTTDHQALLPIHVGQIIIVLGPPIWLWNSMAMASGEYAVLATAHKHHNNNNHSDHALLGLVPVERL